MDPSRPLPPSSQPSTRQGLFPSSSTSSSTSLTSALAQILSNVQNQGGTKLQALLNQQSSWSTQPTSSLPGSRLAQTGGSSLLPQHILTPQSSGTSPQQVQHSAGSMQAIAQIQQALGGTPTRLPPVQSQHHLQASSPPHTQLTPSVANLMGAQAVALLNGGTTGNQIQQGLVGRMPTVGPLRHALNGGPSQSSPGESSPSHLSLGSMSALTGHPQGVSPVAQVLAHHPPHADLYTMSGSRKRGRSDSDADERAKKFHGMPAGSSAGGHLGKLPVADKLSKGLRHFSWRVCEKVQQKKVTTYNEVADELVREMAESEKASMGTSEGAVDHKNIRRRVYDALNVLMAMNIISKEKKEIRWIGLPTNSLQECQHLEDQLSQCESRVKEKTAQLNELILQVLAFNHLIKRNKEEMAKNGPPPPNSAITLPFIIVHTDKDTYIDCSISTDKSEYVFHFDQPFAIHDDLDVLKKMGMAFGLELGTCSAEDLQRAKALLPKAFEAFLTKLATQNHAQAASGGGGPSSRSSSQGTQLDSPFIERRNISGPLGTPSPDVGTPTLTSAGLVGSPAASPIPAASTMIGNSPVVGSLGINSPLLGSVASFSKGSLPSLAGSPLSKVTLPPSPSMLGSPLARPLAGLSSPVKASFGPTATTSPRPSGGGASKVLVQPVSSPGVKRVQAQVLPSSLGVLSPLVKQLQTQGNFGSLSTQNILSCLSQADPNLLNLAQSLLTGGSSPGGMTTSQPTTTGVEMSEGSAQAQSLLQVPPMQSQPAHLPPNIPPSPGSLLPTVVDINTSTHSQLSMPTTAMSLLGQQQQDANQQPGNV